MSVLGIAREVAALTGQPLTGPTLAAVPAASNESFPVDLTAGAGCVRFASRVIRGLNPLAKSPAWMQERLRRAGLRPISAAVDVTNYVMLELGQPLHAYDLRELAGGIVVRRARAGETLKLLDGREIAMDESVLVIADRDKSLGLAGVMGGDHSGIGDDTTDVLLEVAFFLPDAIAGRGRRYGLVTDASQRFERGVDPTLQERAIERATALLCACAGGTPGPTQLAELTGELPQPATVRLRPERARRVIGADIDDATIASLLTGLGMRLDAKRQRVARDTADVALRHRDRGRPDRGDRAHARVRPHSRNGAARAASASRGGGDAHSWRCGSRHARAARLFRGDHVQLHRAGPAGTVRSGYAEPDTEQSDFCRTRHDAGLVVAGPCSRSRVEPASAAAARSPVRGGPQIHRRARRRRTA